MPNVDSAVRCVDLHLPMEELRTEIQENSSKKDNVPVVVGSEYQDTKIQRMVHFFLCRVEKRGWYFESHIHNVIQV